MTFSQRKSWAEKSFDFDNFSINFILLRLSYLRYLFGKIYNFENILSFPWILILNLTRSVLNIRRQTWRLEGVHYYRKNIIFFKNVDKNYRNDFESTWYKKSKIKYVQKTCFPWHNILSHKGEICLKSIILAVNHCVALLRCVLRCVNVWKTELFN